MTPTIVPASEFQRNFGKYLTLVETCDVEVMKDGRVVGLWTSPRRDRLALVDELAGSIHATIDLERDRKERREAQ